MRAFALLPAALVALVTGTASAQSATDLLANRRRLLDQAFEASTRGNHSDALQFAEQAGQIQMSPSIRMFLAQQHEELSRSPEGGDHLVEAATQADACVREATEQVTLNRRVEIMRSCAEVFDRLNPRVARVRLQVPRPTPAGMRLRVNDRDILERDWNNPVAVLPGEVVVDVTTPANGSFHRALTLTAGRIESVAVTLPITENRTASASSGATVTRVVGFTLLGLGVAAGIVGVVELVGSNNQASTALDGTGDQGTAWSRYYNDIDPQRRLSPSDVCARAATDDSTHPDAALANNLCDANATARTMALAFGIGGAALALGGAALLVVSSLSSSSRSSRVDVSPVVGANVGGASLRVRF